MAAGCRPCLERLVRLAENEALEKDALRAAVTIGEFVKDQPAQEMKALAQALLGGDPAGSAAALDCPCDDERGHPKACCG